MSTRNLDALFAPTSIALIGASNRPKSVGGVLARNMLEGGFSGPVLPVNPHEASIRSTLCYRSVAELPITPDLAVISTPPDTVPALIGDLAERGCRAAVVITAGFGEAGGGGAHLKQAMLDAARPSLLRIVGPNCLGVLSPTIGVNASFAQGAPPPGGLALVAQSGAVTAAALDWATARGYGFSRIVTLGDMADVDFGDVLDFLAMDKITTAILLYVESITQARKFMSAARMAGRTKPVVVIKAGRSAAGAKAALSHTGALAGADAVYDAAFRRAGLLRVYELRELFDAVTTLTSGALVKGDRLAIITNGGGAGVMAVDALEADGGRLTELSSETIGKLDKALPAAWSKGDPVDILGDATAQRYADAMNAVLADPGADAVLVMNCPTAVADSADGARAVVEQVKGRDEGRRVLTCWLGDTGAAESRRLFATGGVPTYETPDEAVRAFTHLARHAANRAMLMQTPSDVAPASLDRAGAQALIAAALTQGREMLTDPEAKAVLTAYGVPVATSRTAPDARGAGQVADELGGPVALKILSRDISHKSDVGGVVLGLSGSAQVARAGEEMLARIGGRVPNAHIDGFMIQAMVDRPRARELIAGIALDPTFGPIILFGAGGIAVEILADRVIGLPPLNRALAADMIARTRISALLRAYRDRPAADLDAIADTLIALAQMATELDGLAELDINPLLADEAGVIALDARIRVSPPGAGGVREPAIRPYPSGLRHSLALADGAMLTVRPIRPDDAPRLVEMVGASAAEDVRLRFRVGLERLPAEWAARLSQIDYEREMALVAEESDGAIVGVVRLAAEPDGARAEFALMVRTDHQTRGLGHAMLSEALDYAKARGVATVWGDIERGNARMLTVANDLGFVHGPADDAALLRATKALCRPV
jgi:acetyltransferase